MIGDPMLWCRALFVDFPLMPLSFFQPITNIVWEFGRRTDVQKAKCAPSTCVHDSCRHPVMRRRLMMPSPLQALLVAAEGS